MDAPLMTPAQVAAQLAVSKRTVLRLLETGKLPGLRIGSLWRVNPARLADWVAAHETAAPTAQAATPATAAGRRPVARLVGQPSLPAGAYTPVFPGVVPWRSEVIEPAARRSGSAMRTKRAALSSN